jgi:hypothetical protein
MGNQLINLEQINLGDYANDGTGDDLRTAFAKVKVNFDTIASSFPSPLSEDTAPKLGGDLDLNGYDLISTGTITIHAGQVVVAGSITADQFIGRVSIENNKLDELADVEVGDSAQIEDGQTIMWNIESKKWMLGDVNNVTLKGNLDGGSANSVFPDDDPSNIDGGEHGASL